MPRKPYAIQDQNYPVPGAQIVELGGQWGAKIVHRENAGEGGFFFLREFFSRALLSERLEQARPKWAKCIDYPFSDQKGPQTISFGATHTYELCKGVPPPPVDYSLEECALIGMQIWSSFSRVEPGQIETVEDKWILTCTYSTGKMARQQ